MFHLYFALNIVTMHPKTVSSKIRFKQKMAASFPWVKIFFQRLTAVYGRPQSSHLSHKLSCGARIIFEERKTIKKVPYM